MNMPSELKPALLGAVGGAIVLAIVGFTWLGWVTTGSAETMAKQRADTAVVAALTPVCVANFHAGPDAAMHMAALKKINSWEQGSYVQRAGWAEMPGEGTTHSGLARACADAIGKTEL